MHTVAQAVCRIDKQVCKNAGGVIGSSTSPACRDKQMVESFILEERDLFFSFQTCGSLDTYSTTALQDNVAGSTMFATIVQGIEFLCL